MAAEVDTLEIKQFVNVSAGLKNLKTKVDDLDIGKLKTAPKDLKKLSDVVNREVIKDTEFNKINMQLNKLDKNIDDATTLILINQ